MSNKVYFFCIFIVYFLSVSCNENDSCYYRDISLRNFNYINSGIDTSKALYFFKKEINGFTYEYDMTGENIHKRRIPFVKFDSSVQYYLHKETTERYSNFVLLIAEPSDYSIYHFNIDKYISEIDIDGLFEVESKHIIDGKYLGCIYYIHYSDSSLTLNNLLNKRYNYTNTQIDTIFCKNFGIEEPIYLSNFIRSPKYEITNPAIR